VCTDNLQSKSLADNCLDIDMDIDSGLQIVYDINKNAHLKGRKRFKADLEDMELMSIAGYALKGLRLKSTCMDSV
jgi:ubiquitin-conjugating enzyme E2 Q